MDPKRVHLIQAIQQALAAARICGGSGMTDYLLEMALQEALEEERREIAKAGSVWAPKLHTIN